MVGNDITSFTIYLHLWVSYSINSIINNTKVSSIFLDTISTCHYPLFLYNGIFELKTISLCGKCMQVYKYIYY